MAIVAIFVTWGIISVKIAMANAVVVSYEDYVPREVTHDPAVVFAEPYNYEKIAGDENLELYFDKVHGTIQVKDLKSGNTWKSIVDGEVYENFRKSNQKWKQKMSSSIIVSYNDLEARDGRAAELTHAGECDYMESKLIENGVEVLYGFTVKGIYVTVQYLIEGGELVVKVPIDGITEETRYIVNTVIVLPYFGAADMYQDGYMFYPDGCGAITLFNNAENRVQSVKEAFLKTYTTNKISLDYWLMSDDYERYNAAMPIFGIKNNDNAFLAVVTGGDENSGITVAPAGRVVDVNRIYFELYIRNQFDITAANVTNTDGTVTTGREITRIDRNKLAVDREVRYFFLHDEKANYAGMADAYRTYLIENGKLNDAIAYTDEYLLALSFLMGTTERQLVADKYITMTSFKNLEDIFEDLRAEGIDDAKVVVNHWLKDDEDFPSYWPVASQIGGKSGMADLNSYLAANTGLDVYFANNFIFATNDESGFSPIKDVVYSGIGTPISTETINQEEYFILGPDVVLEHVRDYLSKTKDYANIGVCFTNMGNVVYDDYNEDNPASRRDVINTWQTVLKETQAEGKKTAVEGANQYSYGNVDYLYSIPVSTYGLSITDYAVPFVQMVVSGLIPYSSGIYETGNLTYDLDIQKLEWIEFGALPYFYLTYENALELKDTELNFLFTSTYSFWRDRVIETYKEFEANFGDTYGEQMVAHEVLGEDVRRVEYSNGKVIYINYAETENTEFGITIPAKGYTIVEKEAN